MTLHLQCCLAVFHVCTFGTIFANFDLEGSKPRSKIPGGYPCPISDYPYMVSIRDINKNVHVCSGTLMSEYWVLTAAHCVQGEKTLKVLVGTTNAARPNKTRTQTANVTKIFVHEEYDNETLVNDIAIMQLDWPIEQTDYVNYTTLASYFEVLDQTVDEICANATIIGWGDEYAHRPNLTCSHIPIVTTQKCRKFHKDAIIPNNTLCSLSPNKDACQRDTGGPLLCDGIQYGVITARISCTRRKYPGLYTPVDKYIRFLYRSLSGIALQEQPKSGGGCLYPFGLVHFAYILFIRYFCILTLLK